MAIKDDPNREAYKRQEKRFLELLASKNGEKTTMEDVFIALTGRTFEDAEAEKEVVA